MLHIFAYIYNKTNINQPYGEYIKLNSSNLISAASIDIGRVVQIMSNINNMITGIFISIFIISNLLIINSKIALSSLIIFGSCYFLIGSFTKSRLVRNSKIVTENNVKLVNLIQDIFGSIREVILYQYQDVSLKEYISVDKPMRKYGAENIFIASFPKYILESAGLIFITLIAILLSSASSDNSSIFPLLGVFAISAQRLLPALQQIYVGWSTVKGYQASLIKIKKLVLKKIINYEKYQNNQKLLFTKQISFRNISYRYSIKDEFIFKDLNFEIFKGEKIGLIGSTGAGKSTLINMAMGFLPPSKGQICIDDKLISDISEINNLREWQKLIAYVPQNIYLKDGSFIENIAFGIKKEEVNLAMVMKAAKKAQIKDFIESTENGFNSNVGERGILLSGGQAQRIAIARALYRESKILILDEATSALDVSTEKQIIKSIFLLEKKLTLIMITHRLSTLKFFDRILLIKSGKLETISYKKAMEIMNKNLAL